MSSKMFMVIDLDRCWGCKACEVACKQELGLGAGPRPMKVEEIGPRVIGGALHRDFVPTLCQHCDQAACQAVCPVPDCIYREADGSIQIKKDACIGCGYCVTACPFGVLEPNAEGGPPFKCTLCHERRKDGALPSCAQHCIGRALTLVTEDSLSGLLQDRDSWKTGRIIYVTRKWVQFGAAFQSSGTEPFSRPD
jgi:Fe-S-cluster-containing dehydrogenase component